jgi:hypothetical protein
MCIYITVTKLFNCFKYIPYEYKKALLKEFKFTTKEWEKQAKYSNKILVQKHTRIKGLQD